MQSIQDSIKGGVLKEVKWKIYFTKSKCKYLKIIMRSIYLEYAIYNTNLLDSEIKRLNKIVIDNCVERLYNESVAYENIVTIKALLLCQWNALKIMIVIINN